VADPLATVAEALQGTGHVTVKPVAPNLEDVFVSATHEDAS
jgi:hypothetical protein